ncbi:MAG: hypothetical protein IPK27_07755 [Rhodanobacteraceae bacterium]|nr:hypothetical protein [Rhodanobacteraceae bacterium]
MNSVASLERRLLLLASEGPERAFSPDPDSDSWKLHAGGNGLAISFLKSRGLRLVHVVAGEAYSLVHFSGGMLSLVTTWEPYSAKTIGSLRVPFENREVLPLGMVLFEHTRDEVLARKSMAWYFEIAYVLDAESLPFRELVAEVPMHLLMGSAGAVERVLVRKV